MEEGKKEGKKEGEKEGKKEGKKEEKMLKQNKSLLVRPIYEDELYETEIKSYNEAVAFDYITSKIADGYTAVDITTGFEAVSASTGLKVIGYFSTNYPAGIYNLDVNKIFGIHQDDIILTGIVYTGASSETIINSNVWFSNWQQSITANNCKGMTLKYGNWHLIKDDGRMYFGNLSIEDSIVNVKANTLIDAKTLTNTNFYVKNYLNLTNKKWPDHYKVINAVEGVPKTVSNISSSCPIDVGVCFAPIGNKKYLFGTGTNTTSFIKYDITNNTYETIAFATTYATLEIYNSINFGQYVFFGMKAVDGVFSPQTVRYDITTCSQLAIDIGTTQGMYALTRDANYIYGVGNSSKLSKYNVFSASISNVDLGYTYTKRNIIKVGDYIYTQTQTTADAVLLKYHTVNSSISTISLGIGDSWYNVTGKSIIYDGINNLYIGYQNIFKNSSDAQEKQILKYSMSASSAVGLSWPNYPIWNTSVYYNSNWAMKSNGNIVSYAWYYENHIPENSFNIFDYNNNTFTNGNHYDYTRTNSNAGDYIYNFGYNSGTTQFHIEALNAQTYNANIQSPAVFNELLQTTFSTSEFSRINIDVGTQYHLTDTINGKITKQFYNVDFLPDYPLDDSFKNFNANINWLVKREDIESELTTDFTIKNLTLYGSSAGTYDFTNSFTADENFLFNCYAQSDTDKNVTLQWYNGELKKTTYNFEVSSTETWNIQGCFQLWRIETIGDIQNLINMPNSPISGNMVFDNVDNEVVL